MKASAVASTNLFPAPGVNTVAAKGENTDSFSQIFAAQTDTKTAENAQESVVKSQKGQDASTNKPEDAAKTQAAEETESTQETAKEETKVIEDEKTTGVLSKEDLERAAEALVAMVSEVLNVSPEELQKTLDALGMCTEDLLDVQNVTQLVVAMTEGADELSVMTNEEVFTNISEITDGIEKILTELSEETQIPTEELKNALEQLLQAQETEEAPVVYAKAEPTQALTDQEIAVTLQNTPIENVKTSASRETQNTNPSSQQETHSEHANDHMQKETVTFAQTVTEQLEQAVAKTDAVTTSYTTTTESVMNQIQDSIRVLQSQDMTEMELQLHPASLGNLRIQIAAKEGVITATFTTENEAVKTALEAQMVTLKENFAQQGVRVEAVEVTVASHAFEQNLNGDDNHAEDQPTAEKKRGSRRISLSQLEMEDLEEELSDEDRIVAEMMKQNGNTVDYTV